MGWLTNETKSFYIARPDVNAHDLIYLHPDKSIPRGAKLTVRSDECALFFREGRYIGRINAGTVVLDTENIPFLGHLVIDRFTDANHFLCEIFFVSLKESIVQVELSALGQFKDLNSANVVSIFGQLSYTIKVQDPPKLIVELGGQNAYSGIAIQEICTGRILNQLRKAVGSRTQRSAALDVVSNIDAEAISQDIRDLGNSEFSPLGLVVGRVFDLSLSLDHASLDVLRSFGKQESELALQAKGMHLATGDGFAEFNLIQGQRAALEGLGRGFGSGNGPVVMTGMNLGANLTGPASSSSRRSNQPSGRPGKILSSNPMFIVISQGGDTGPYSIRQLTLMAISKNIPLANLTVRRTDDANDVAFSAELEPEIVAEYKRRSPPSAARSQTANNAAFELAFNAATNDGVLTNVEVDTLANLAFTLGLDPDRQAGLARVVSMAKNKSISIPE